MGANSAEGFVFDVASGNNKRQVEPQKPLRFDNSQMFGDDDRIKASPYYDRGVDVMEEPIKFTLLTRSAAAYRVDRYSERKETAEELRARVNLRSL